MTNIGILSRPILRSFKAPSRLHPLSAPRACYVRGDTRNHCTCVSFSSDQKATMDSPSSPESDRDVALDEDLEALRRACVLSPTCASPIAVSNEDSDFESDDDADRLLRRLREQIQDSPSGSPSSFTPLSTRPPPFLESLSPFREAVGGLDDEGDDYETLRNIQRTLARYEAGVC
jgi:hypothetical protein